MILEMLAKNWWLILLRGIVAIVFGFLAFAWPGVTLITFVILYGAYVAADGLLALIAAIKGGSMAPRWWLAFVGIAGLGAAAATFLYPGLTALVLLMFVAAWSIVHGLMEIIGAIQLRKEIDNEWLLIFSGLLSVLFGILLWMRPGAGAVALVWLIGAYAVAFGILMVALSFTLKKHRPIDVT
jgi:uncharacterized membrane protein HdeD (DUF308 family)